MDERRSEGNCGTAAKSAAVKKGNLLRALISIFSQ
jgi:hypothetical protein